MDKQYTNEYVYDFLAEECRQEKNCGAEFCERILSRMTDADFWELLSEQLDCFRICEECGKPMIEGYVVDGCNTYCSEECLHKHVSEEEYKKLYDNSEGDTYWTTWYEDSITFKSNCAKQN